MSSRLHARPSDRPLPKPSRNVRRSPTLLVPADAPPADAPAPSSLLTPAGIIATGALAAAGTWSYWPTLVKLADTWNQVADYSHGYFVLPMAAAMLWLRRGSFPGFAGSSPILGIALVILSLALRYAGDLFFISALDGWSIVPWTAGMAAILGGRSMLLWAWPAILFLVFMVPLPYSLEFELSGPLQGIATVSSTAILQFLGQPAFQEGNVILLGNDRLEVAQACSGLRLFFGILALTYALVAVLGRPWWENLLLIAAAVPIAIAANVARIIATGLGYRLWADEYARQWVHDVAGWGMVLFAAVLFGLFLAYLRCLIKEERIMDMSAIIKRSHA